MHIVEFPEVILSSSKNKKIFCNFFLFEHFYPSALEIFEQKWCWFCSVKNRLVDKWEYINSISDEEIKYLEFMFLIISALSYLHKLKYRGKLKRTTTYYTEHNMKNINE